MKSSSKIDHEHFSSAVQGSALNEFAFAISTQFILELFMIYHPSYLILSQQSKER